MNVASQLAAVVEAGRADTAERRRKAEAALLDFPDERLLLDIVPLFTSDAKHIAANDPATVLRLCDQEDRHYAAAEDIIHSHAPGFSRVAPLCEYDGDEWPCSEIRAEAARWGIS